MRKLILMAVAIGLAFSARAQSVNGVKLADLKAPYIELREIKKVFSEKRWVWLDYGQKIRTEEEAYIKDDNGREKVYNSVLDCVNQLKDYGYELLQVYVRVYEDSSEKTYVLKKMAN